MPIKTTTKVFLSKAQNDRGHLAEYAISAVLTKNTTGKKAFTDTCIWAKDKRTYDPAKLIFNIEQGVTGGFPSDTYKLSLKMVEEDPGRPSDDRCFETKIDISNGSSAPVKQNWVGEYGDEGSFSVDWSWA